MAGQDDLWAWLQSMGVGPGGVLPGGARLPASVGGGTYPYPASTPGAGPGGLGTAGDDSGFNNPYAAAAQALPAQGGPYVGSGPPGPQAAPFAQPQHPSTMRYPMWPTSAAPAGAPSATPQSADAGGVGPLAASGQGGIGSDAKFPLKRRAGAPNLGYYQPMSGNARGATWAPYTDPKDPRIFRG